MLYRSLRRLSSITSLHFPSRRVLFLPSRLVRFRVSLSSTVPVSGQVHCRWSSSGQSGQVAVRCQRQLVSHSSVSINFVHRSLLSLNWCRSSGPSLSVGWSVGKPVAVPRLGPDRFKFHDLQEFINTRFRWYVSGVPTASSSFYLVGKVACV